MFGLGFPELLVIFVLCLAIFGPGKLPEIGGALGTGIRDFQRALKQPPEIEVTPPRPSGGPRP
jgi:sec-independent protein translocase protein TatA